jgi:16S rRNA (guanine1207-N2)-methyltransferase
VVKDASQLFGPGGVVDYHKGNRVVRFAKPQANQSANCPWLDTPGVAPGTWHHLALETPAGKLDLVSLPGVFSYDRLDEGTALLLETVRSSPGERVLDLGCGCGVIGILAAQMGAARVDLVDSSLLAVACAQANLANHQLANARALASDGLSSVQDQRYERILSNPPFHAGKGVDYRMAEAFIQQSWQALEADGTLALVANRFIRYESIIEKYFSQVSVLAETGKFRVLAGRK